MVFAAFVLNVQKTSVFAHSIQKKAKNLMFLYFYAVGRSPSNHRWPGGTNPHALRQGCVRWSKNAKNIWFLQFLSLMCQKR